jgi:hypothetical protein
VALCACVALRFLLRKLLLASRCSALLCLREVREQRKRSALVCRIGCDRVHACFSRSARGATQTKASTLEQCKL